MVITMAKLCMAHARRLGQYAWRTQAAWANCIFILPLAPAKRVHHAMLRVEKIVILHGLGLVQTTRTEHWQRQNKKTPPRVVQANRLGQNYDEFDRI